ncbi:MAG: hypothetical protein MKZ66_11690, partial [Acidimicrobiales bacterium]|nr:hypothetical protein [Acidimicrobiales bacterium]
MADHRPSDGTDDWVRRNVDWIVGLLVVAVIVLSVLVWRMDNRIDCLEDDRPGGGTDAYGTNFVPDHHSLCPGNDQQGDPYTLLVGADPSKKPVVVPAGRQTVLSPAGGVGYISHEFNRGEVEDYVEVMVRRQNKG